MDEHAKDAPALCAACGAHNPHGSNFCESCGASLAARDAGDDGVGEGRPRPRALTRDERAEKIQNQRTLSDARQKLGYIRWFLRFAAIGFAIYGVIPQVMTGDPDILQTVSYMMWGIALVMFAGSLFLHRQPFAWTVGMAGFLSVLVLLVFAIGGSPFIELVVAIGMWGAVPLMARTSRLLRERGDEFSSEDLKRRVGRDVGPSEARRHAAERRRAAGRQKLKTYAILGVSIVTVLAIGILLFQLLTASASIDGRVDTFVTAFESGDFDKVQAMCTADERRESWYKVERVLAAQGWHPAGADLGDPSYESRSDRWAEVHFELPRGVMKTAWVYQGSAWQIERFRFAGLRDG